MDGIRIGKVSSYDEGTGTASIYYPDKGTNATEMFPVLSPFGVLQKLNKDDLVLVTHLSDGSESAVVIGKFSTFSATPKVNITASMDGNIQVETGGTVRMKAGGELSLESGSEVNLKGGNNLTNSSEIVGMKEDIEDLKELTGSLKPQEIQEIPNSVIESLT